MTLPTNGRAPSTDVELVRSFHDRLNRLEQGSSSRAGSWVLSTDVGTGNLIATAPGQPRVVLNEAVVAATTIATRVVQAAAIEGVPADTQTIAEQVFALLYEAVTNIVALPGQALDFLSDFIKKLLGPDSPLNASNLFGTAFPGLFDLIPLSSVGPADVNHISNPFANAESIAPNEEGWAWDGTDKFGLLSAGSASIIPDGTLKELYSDPISVVAGQEVNLRVQVKWEDLAATTTPISLVAVAYQVADNGTYTEVEAVAVDSIPSSPLPDRDWTELRGSYIVPTTVGNQAVEINQVGFMLRVAATATAGTVKFSASRFSKSLVPGIAPVEWVAGLTDTLDATDEFLSMMGAKLLGAVTGFGGLDWLFQELEDEFTSWFDDTQTTAGQASDALGWLQDTWDAFVQGGAGSTDTGWSFPDVFNVAAQNKKELTEIAAGLQQLQADQTAQLVSGRSYVVTVSEYGGFPSGFAKFVDEGGGSISNDGDTLEFTNDTGRELFVYGNTELLTDYFEVSLVVPRQAGMYFASYGNRRVWFIGRANHPTAPTRYCMGYVGGNKCRAGCVVGGVTTWFGAEQTITPGSYMTFRGGVGVEPRDFQFLVNNQVRGVFEDTGAVSFFGAGYRYTGFGIQNEANDVINRVPNVSHIAANDNQPPPVVGIGFKLYRANSASGGGGTTPSTSYPVRMDSVEYVTDHFTVISQDPCVVQFNRTGHYMLEGRIQSNTTFKATLAGADPKQLLPVLEIGSNRFQGQPASSAADGFGNSQGVRVMSHTWIKYITAGTQVEFAYDVDIATQSWGQIGDSDGTLTYFTGALLNQNTS